jgi:hypothetical protein
MPECSSIVQLDYEIDKCKHSNIIISGGVVSNGMLQDTLVGFEF